MKVTTGLGLVLLLVGMSTGIGCRETAMPFETIDAIAVLERADLHGQLGHLIQVESTPTNGQGEGATVVYAKVFDKDISDAPYYLQWRHTPVRAGDYLSNIADILGRAESLALVTELPKGASLYEEVVIGKPNTIAERITHHLEVTTADGVFYLGVHIVFTDTVKAWFATKLSQPLRIFFLEEKEGAPPPQLLLSLLPDVVRTAITKDDDGTLTVSLQKEVVAATPVSNEETLTLAAYRRDVLEPPPPTAGPPTIIVLSAVSDNTDTTQAVTGDTVTLTFTTNKPIVLQRSRLTFTTENGTHGRVIKAVSGVDNRYTSALRITDAMAAGTLSVSVTLVDDDNNNSGTIVRDTAVAISRPVTIPPPVEPPVVTPPLEPVVHADPKHWRASTDKTAFWLTSYSNGLHGVAQRQAYSDAELLDRYKRGFPSISREHGIDGTDTGLHFIFYDLYRICLDERPEIAADAVKTGIVVHPIANNRLVFDWMRLGSAYPEKSKEERLLLFRRLVRFWGTEGPEDWWWSTDKIGINELNWGTIVPKERHIYVQPPDDPYVLTTERQVKIELEEISQVVHRLSINHPDAPVIRMYNSILSSSHLGIRTDFVFTDLWNIYKAEQPAQAAAIAVDDIPLHPISSNGLLVAWLVLQYDNPETSKEERLVLFRQLARQGKVQVILAE